MVENFSPSFYFSKILKVQVFLAPATKSSQKKKKKKKKTSISNPRQKVHFQKKKTHKICFYIPSLSSLLQKWRTEGAAGRHHWASTIVITVFSKTSPLLQALFRYSLLHLYLSLRNYSKFYPNYWILRLP